MSDSIGISLGFNCEALNFALKNGIRNKKSDGYLTCPFDFMFASYMGVIKCIEEDFLGLCDPVNLSMIKIGTLKPCSFWQTPLDEEWLCNSKYNFLFSHESNHANLHLIQNWEGGKEHFTANNYSNFINRYTKRINNFRSYISSGKFINFVINKFTMDVSLLDETIKRKYPDLKYTIIRINTDDINFYKNNMMFGSKFIPFDGGDNIGLLLEKYNSMKKMSDIPPFSLSSESTNISYINTHSNIYVSSNCLVNDNSSTNLDNTNTNKNLELIRYYTSFSNTLLSVSNTVDIFWICALSLHENFGVKKSYKGLFTNDTIITREINEYLNLEYDISSIFEEEEIILTDNYETLIINDSMNCKKICENLYMNITKMIIIYEFDDISEISSLLLDKGWKIFYIENKLIIFNK